VVAVESPLWEALEEREGSSFEAGGCEEVAGLSIVWVEAVVVFSGWPVEETGRVDMIERGREGGK
jgi:hypothetical protein